MKTESQTNEFTIMVDYGGAYAWDWESTATDLEELFPDSKGIADLERKFESWQDQFESHIPDMKDGKVHDLDWPSFHAEGIKLCHELKAIVGNSARVFYWKPFEDPCDQDNAKFEILLDGAIAVIDEVDDR